MGSGKGGGGSVSENNTGSTIKIHKPFIGFGEPESLTSEQYKNYEDIKNSQNYKSVMEEDIEQGGKKLIAIVKLASALPEKEQKYEAIVILNDFMQKIQSEYSHEPDYTYISSLATNIYQGKPNELIDAIKTVSNPTYGGKESLKILMGLQYQAGYQQGCQANFYEEYQTGLQHGHANGAEDGYWAGRDSRQWDMWKGALVGSAITAVVALGIYFSNGQQISKSSKPKMEQTPKPIVKQPQP